MMRKKLLLVSMSVGLMALMLAPSAQAIPIVNSTVLDLGDGTWRYDYELFNPGDSTENIFDFGLYFEGTPVEDSVIAPAGWSSISGLGFIGWFSTDPANDLFVGSTLGGFSFESALGPGDIVFSSLGANAVTGEVGVTEYGQTTGPNLTAVPEPGTLLLLGTGLTTLVARRRRSKLQT
jgi:hypothetical protein